MNKVFRYAIRALLPLLPLALLAAGCGKEAGQTDGDGGEREYTLTIHFPVQTRANYTTELSDETLIRNGYLFVFNSYNSNLEYSTELSASNEWYEYDSSAGDATYTWRMSLYSGSYYYYVVFNVPDGDLSGISSRSDLLAYQFKSSNEASGSDKYFQMWGVTQQSTGIYSTDVSVYVNRVAARVALRKVTNSHPDGHAVTLNRAWLSNAAGDYKIGTPSSVSTWYNIQGRSDRTESHVIDGSAYTASLPLMTYKDIDRTISNGGSCDLSSSPLLFYCYPNPSTTANAGFTSSFGGEYTVLVLDTTIDGATHYYPVPLNIIPSGHTYPLESNYSYAIDVVISGNGSPDPNDPDDKVATEASVTITIEDWITGASNTEEI